MAGSSQPVVPSVGALLRWRAESPSGAGYTFLSEGEVESRLTYRELDRRARAIAAQLLRTAAPGDRAVLLFPPGLDFVAAFFGCLYSGVIAVPAYPPSFRKDLSRLRAILGDADPRVVLAPAETVAKAEAAPDLPPVPWMALAEEGADEAGDRRLPEIGPDTVAFLQYTSGSTGDPKGVVVTQGNLLANEAVIQRVFDLGADSVVVSWLPLYHDMGLIGGMLQPLYAGGSCVLMSPVSFLQRPRRWLEAISRYRGTVSGAPDFAYDLCVRRIPPAQREGLDLSSWSVAFNGAEPVRAATLERFADAFAPCGFRRTAFSPCYGLAEATLMVAGVAAAEPPAVLAVDAAALAARRAVPETGAAAAVPLAGSGAPALGQEVAVVDPEAGVPCAAGEVGEIWVRGPSVARGYWRRPEETERTFAAHLATGEGPYLRTGDLGFLHGGQLYVTGRLKDLIILRGRNLYPQDIEATVERSAPAFRAGGGAAFAMDLDGQERLVVVQEVERAAAAGGGDGLRPVADALRAAVAEEHEAEVFVVVLVRAGGVPRTTSGKVRRRDCRAAWLAGELPVLFEARAGVGGGEGEGQRDVEGALQALRAAGPEERPETARAYVAAALARALRIDPAGLEPDRPVAALGLDSLAAIELCHRLEADLGLALQPGALLEGATPAGLAADVLRLAGAVMPPAGPARPDADPGGEAPLSYGQRALWYLHRLAPESGAYNLAVALRIRGPLDADRLRAALQGLVDRHPALRTAFPVEGGGEPVRRVFAEALLAFAGRRVESLEEVDLQAAADAPFDLERGPLVRAHLWSAGDAEHALLLGAHHIAADFWSLSLLARQLGELYAGNPVPATAATPATPADTVLHHARRQQRLVASPEGERLWEYWRRQLAGEPAPLDLPVDRPRPPVQSHRGGVCRRVIPGLAELLRDLARPAGATLSMTVLAGWQAQLHRLSGQTDFLVGVPTAGRGRAELAGAVGYFVNPLPLRADLSGDPGFAEHLGRVRRASLEALEHAELPLAVIVERSRPGRDLSRSPLFQVLFTFQSVPPGDEHLAALALGQGGVAFELGGLRCESMTLDTAWAQMDLELMAAEVGGDLALALRHDCDLFDSATAERLLAQLERLAAAATDSPESRIADLPLLGDAERHQMLVEWNRTLPAAAPACCHDLVAEQARRTPDALALAAAGLELTYRELLARAESLAAHLRELGVGPEVPVGVCSRRTPEMVVGILGTLQAGGAYVPLDPGYPVERLGWILEESGAPVLLADRGAPAELLRRGTRIVDLEAAMPPAGAAPRRPGDPDPENLACILYTSGSTGRPKGVGVRHSAVAALLRWAAAAYSLADLARTLFSTSISFDLSLFEMLAPLASGGRVVLVPDALALTAADGVTLLNTVPSAALDLLERGPLPGTLRVVNLAGEPLPRALVDRLHAALPGVRVYNLYGPSEDTTYSTGALQEPGAAGPPPIGKPVAGSRAYVLDRQMRPVLPGAPGELYVGGDGLARGYVGRPDLTAERFGPDPFGPAGARLYRTGDRARWRPDGELEFLGRIDHQVKLRGFRIELGEVEEALRRHSGVRDAAVLAVGGEGSERRLVACLVAEREPAPGARELRGFLAERLPPFMVPAAFVPLPAFPLTPNGKVDRRALASLAAGAPAAARPDVPFVAPRTTVEGVVAALWADLLGLDRVGVHDSFFELGGHSLLAARAAARLRELLGVEVPLRVLLERPTAAGVAAAVEDLRGSGLDSAADEGEAAPRPGAPRRDLPLSFAQERLWLVEQLGGTGAAYTLALGHRLRGPLDPAALEQALADVLARQEALRATFPSRDGRPAQQIAAASAFPLRRVDLTALPAAEREAAVLRRARGLAILPFDLERGPLVRTALLELGPEDRVLVLAVHHIVADGASVGVFTRELGALYDAAREGRPSPLTPLPLGYADYVLWQRRRLTGERQERLAQAWRERLAGVPGGLELPTDRTRPPAQTFRGGVVPVAFDAGFAASLRRLAHGRGATLFMGLLAAFQALLHRHTGQADLVVGVPAAGRQREEWESVVGLFVNMLPLRGDLSGDPVFGELLARARRTALDGFAGEELPFERIVEAAALRRDPARNPLFQAVLAFQDAGAGGLRLAGVAAEPFEIHTGTAKFELSLSIAVVDEGIAGSLEYNADLFDAATAGRLARHLDNLLRGAVERPAARMSELPLLSAAESWQLRGEWNDTAAATAPDFLARLAAVAARYPDAVALESEAGSWTYAELAARSTRLAGRLRRLGVGPEAVVGLCGQGSLELIAGLVAVLTAGGAFLPLDPAYPAERLAFMLADSGARLVLAGRQALAEVPPGDHGVLLLEDALDDLGGPGEPGEPSPLAAADPAGLAYVIYTSGSTGRPKGVQISRGGLANLAAAQEAVFGLGPGRRVLQLSSTSFDAFVWEVAMALGAGATLCLAPRPALLPGADLARTLVERRVSHMTLPPSALAALPSPSASPLPGLEAIVVAGEACPPELAARWAAGRQFFDAYGPTESTVCATVERFAGGRLTIGRPLAGLAAHVPDCGLRSVPVGVPGELCVGGAGLARGYRSRPDLTAAAFIPDPFAGAPGVRLYRTGDLARRLPDGRLEFLGRLDDQVKVRGFRVEPGEVEAALAAHPAVATCAVVARPDGAGGAFLVGYVVPAGASGLAAEEILRFLRERLPSWLVPSRLVAVPELPRTSSGKVDRRALPEPSAAPADPGAAPRTPAEELIASIWENLLGLSGIGAQDDFFAVGGHSLLAAQAAARLREAFGVEVPVATLFTNPTLTSLALALDEARRGSAREEIPLERRPAGLETAEAGGPPLSFAQERLWFLQELSPGTAAYNVFTATRLEGPLDVPALHWSLGRVTARHESLRTVFPRGGTRPVQRVTAWPGPALPVVDLTALPPAAREAAARRHLREEAARPFDLEAGPLFRALLLRQGEATHDLLLTLHHIVADGWSMDVLARELAAFYGAAAPALPALPPLDIQPADVARWQRAALSGGALAPQVAYWRSALAGASGTLDLPIDRPRPAVQTDRGGAVPLTLPAEVARDLRAAAHREGATVFMALLAGLAAVLHRYTGEEDLVIGTPVAHRTRKELEGLVGLFVNTLPLRCDLTGDPTWRELLGRVRGTALGAYVHQDVPFEWLVEELHLRRDLSRGPLFQVMLFLQEGIGAGLALPGLRCAPVPLHNGTAKLDLTISLTAMDGALDGGIELNAALFDLPTIERLAGHFGCLLRGGLADSGCHLSALPLLDEAERHQLLAGWNGTAAAGGATASLYDLFAAQASRTPEAAAVHFRDRWLSYRELAEKAEVLARRLRALGVAAGDRVGICLERSAELPAALLGVLAAGAAYLPLDPALPEARIAGMVEEAAPAALIVRRGSRRGSAACPLVFVDEDGEGAQLPGAGPGAEAPAYLMYTSGSTGRPKGVVVTHRNVLNFFAAMDEVLAADATGVWLAVTGISFDISVLELLWTLCRGYTVVVQEELRATPRPAAGAGRPARPLDFSLFYFADAGGDADRYRLLLDGARFADEHGFAAVWTPERHFHSFGGLYPSPAVTGAAVAAVTRRVGVRAGSVVLPLHDPLRVAEEWSVVDNLSRGRAGVSFASGWHADDFVLAPDSYAARKEVMLRGIDEVRRLWRGEPVRRRGGAGQEIDVRIYPPPVQAELPFWLTAAGNAETFREAGRLGANLLTHLLGQSVEELAEKIAVYRAARREAGHDPESGVVTLMLHTFVGRDQQEVRARVRGPLTEYLRSSVGLVDNLARSLGLGADAGSLSPADLEALLDHAFERYFATSSLLGTREECRGRVARFQSLGVDEIGCLIDFGVEVDAVLASLADLAALREDVQAAAHRQAGEDDYTLAVQAARHGATHLQCTPSLAALLVADPASREALRPLRKLLVGGEALPAPLAEQLTAAVGGEVLNMYGPTETTVWSLYDRVLPGERVTLGRPLRNTGVHVLDPRLQPVPVGVPGEVWLSGDGVTAGYWRRPDLTAERFLPDPFGESPGGRLYRTGDRARRLPDGRLHFLGRADHQVKIRGHRIEPGEVEEALRRHPGVAEAVVMAREEASGDRCLLAWVVPEGGGGVAPSRLEPKGELPPDRPRFRLPNGMVVTYLRDFQARTGYEEVFEDEIYLRHGIELPDNACVFDVGANIGFFSLWLHGRCRNPRVFAFEPIPPTFATLAANMALYGLDVRLFNQGVGDRPGRADFGFYPNAPGLSGRFAGTAEDRAENRAIILDWLRKVANPDGAAAFSPEELEKTLDEQLRVETCSCEIVTLSDVIREHGVERIDLLKVDVEKSELDVLRGLRDEDWGRIDQVVLEIHTRELLESITALLTARGYRLGVEEVAVVDGAAAEHGQSAHVYMLYAVSERRRGGAAAGTRPALSPGELRRHLAARLPEPMIPAAFVILETLPRTSNGKIDRRALPAPSAERPQVESVFVAPATQLERSIAVVWQEVLRRDRIGIHDNFFEVGGTSLLLVQVQTRMRQALRREVAMVQMFRHPTVHTLAQALARDEDTLDLAEAGERGRLQSGVAEQTSAFRRQRQFLEDRKRQKASLGRPERWEPR